MMCRKFELKGNEAENKYEPTLGCRIIEIEKLGEVEKKVELWDVSGDEEYENCWPAILSGTAGDTVDGVILVFDPNRLGQREEIKHWYHYFVSKPGMVENKCMILVHESFLSDTPPSSSAIYNLPQELQTECEVRQTSIEKPEVLLRTVSDFIRTISTQ
uniref:Uncharacterized protein n=1 Tax=Eucampia antarctica TaxID=49252 RepID=A0A7S2QZW4_9STRA